MYETRNYIRTLVNQKVIQADRQKTSFQFDCALSSSMHVDRITRASRSWQARIVEKQSAYRHQMAPPKRPERSAESVDEYNPSDAGAGGNPKGPAAIPLLAMAASTPSGLPHQ
jgi:hypothetical protein